MKSIGAMLAAALLLGACTISGPKVKVEPATVKAKPGTVEVELGESRSYSRPGTRRRIGVRDFHTQEFIYQPQSYSH